MKSNACKALLCYFATVLFALILGVCFIFSPKMIWPFYPFVWLLPVAVILYGLVIVVIYLCRCRWQLFLKNVVIVAVELVILLAAFFSMAILCAIYNDDDGVEQLPTLSMTVNDEDAIDGSHIVNVAVPIPSMTNDVVRVLNCSRVSTVVTKCTDLEKFVPDQNAVDLVAQSDVYLSLGLPFEDSLCKRALQKNSALKIFNVTNGCYTIDKNIYVWLTPENMTTIAANVRRSLLPENKFLSWSCMSLKDQYKNLGLTVAIAHPALEYPCRYFGLRFVRIYDSAGLIKREEIKRIIRDSNAVIILAVECQMEELPLVVPQGIEVGAIDIFEETALVQFTKLIHRAVVIYTDRELENTGDNNCEHR